MNELQEVINENFKIELPTGVMTPEDYVKPYKILELAYLTHMLLAIYNGFDEDVEKYKKLYKATSEQTLESFINYVNKCKEIY